MPLFKTVPASDPDILAKRLIQVGELGRNFPPSWNGARISVPVCGPDGQYVGRVLPGKGLYLDMDLKSVGINKPLPLVFEKTPVQRLCEVFNDDRYAIKAAGVLLTAALFPKLIPFYLFGTISTYADIVTNRVTNRKVKDVTLTKLMAGAGIGNFWCSLWTKANMANSSVGPEVVAGTYTNIPTGAVHDQTTVGAWSKGLIAPTGSDHCYLLTWGMAAQYNSGASVGDNLPMFLLHDLLVGAGNINTNINTLQTVTSAALTRYTTGAGVMMAFEVTSTLGGTPANLTVTYTNQAGTGSRSTGAIAMDLSAAPPRLVPSGLGPIMQLQSGDYGVQTVADATFSAAMGSGVVALNLYFPLAIVAGPTNGNGTFGCYNEFDLNTTIHGLVELTAASGVLGCLNVYFLSKANSGGVALFFLRTVNG